MHTYLVAKSEHISSQAPRELPPAAQWETWRKKRQSEYLHWLGLDRYVTAPSDVTALTDVTAPTGVTAPTDVTAPTGVTAPSDVTAPTGVTAPALPTAPAPPLNKKTTQIHRRDGYRIECIAFESLPGVWVEANVYIPDGAYQGPAILYACGHADLQKAAYYQDHARAYARLGFTTLIYETVQLGEVRGYHRGTHQHGWFHWISRGFTPVAIEVWNGMRALDLLTEMPEVDENRLGVTGNSGGGAISWWLAAADDRVRAVSPSSGTGTVASHIRERTLDTHCDCMFPINTKGWALSDFAALIAPRPVFIVSAANDHHFSINSIDDFHRQLAKVYEHIDKPQQLELFTYPHRHGYNEEARRRTFSWFLRQLQHKNVSWQDVPDVDDKRETPETLTVHVHGLPANDRSTTVHDWFIPVASAPQVTDAATLKSERHRVTKALHELTFATFPSPLPDPQPTPSMTSFLPGGVTKHRFTFVPETGVRLTGTLTVPEKTHPGTPIMVELLNPDTPRDNADTLSKGMPGHWLHASLAPRGTGDTAWSPAQQWFLRRAAALTGRTIASLRVLDVMQGLRTLRTFPYIDPRQIYITAQGEIAIAALYAALLDGNVAGLILHDPPATHDAPDSSPGSGPCVEMLNVLRVTDLPYVSGLVWPTRLVFVGGRPAAYLWAEQLHARLGHPGGVWNVARLQHWTPVQ